jgi:DNA uptake protein ComE-like DNA-binding protein
LKNKVKEFLHFGKSERNAIAILIVAILGVFLLPRYIFSIQQPTIIDNAEFSREIDEFLKRSEKTVAADQREFDFTRPDKSVAKDRIKPFPFDPNQLDQKGWEKLGFTERQAAGIVKFKEKGGKFRVKTDVKKLFVVDDEIYGLLESYIQLPDKVETAYTSDKKEYPKSSGKEYIPHRAELNSADSASLVKVRGIGPAFAKRIMRYRDKLGGFSDIGQLQEVYGMDSARFIQIQENLFADEGLIKKININKASLDELRAHPYIDYYIAKALVDKRIQKGAFTDLIEIKEIPLIYESLFLKLRPYLTVKDAQ